MRPERICVIAGSGWREGRLVAAALEERSVPFRFAGEAAFFQRPYSSADVIFLKGPFVVSISVGFALGPPTQEAAVTLAQQAAARVPAS